MSDERAHRAMTELARAAASPADVAEAILAAGFDALAIMAALNQASKAERVHIVSRFGPGPACGAKVDAPKYEDNFRRSNPNSVDATCLQCLFLAHRARKAWREPLYDTEAFAPPPLPSPPSPPRPLQRPNMDHVP